MEQLYARMGLTYFIAATVSLLVMAFILLVSAGVEIAIAILTSSDVVKEVLDSIGLLIIGFAVIETSKFIAEEEIFRKRELRSSVESRRSLTKFITIIVIASSLEALVMVFQTSRDDISNSVYPAALFIASMFALVALGAYQWLSSRIDYSAPEDQREEDHEIRKQDERASDEGTLQPDTRRHR